MINLYANIILLAISIIVFFLVTNQKNNPAASHKISALSALTLIPLYLVANQLQNTFLTFNFQLILFFFWILIWIIYLAIYIQNSDNSKLGIFWTNLVTISAFFFLIENIGLVFYLIIR
ncbi:MAG: hypothetical protein LBC17_03620 [Lactobacillaceae bacterium]|jgi:hypothetical protein|nr:hypothetical protein [Lactobacillaceae bacterium]